MVSKIPWEINEIISGILEEITKGIPGRIFIPRFLSCFLLEFLRFFDWFPMGYFLEFFLVFLPKYSKGFLEFLLYLLKNSFRNFFRECLILPMFSLGIYTRFPSEFLPRFFQLFLSGIFLGLSSLLEIPFKIAPGIIHLFYFSWDSSRNSYNEFSSGVSSSWDILWVYSQFFRDYIMDSYRNSEFLLKIPSLSAPGIQLTRLRFPLGVTLQIIEEIHSRILPGSPLGIFQDDYSEKYSVFFHWFFMSLRLRYSRCLPKFPWRILLGILHIFMNCSQHPFKDFV